LKPVFVSVGHRLDLETAARLTLACTIRHRLPEPTALLTSGWRRRKEGQDNSVAAGLHGHDALE
jgi:deoxyinosine 3'endonuclease (endonuclease V)